MVAGPFEGDKRGVGSVAMIDHFSVSRSPCMELLSVGYKFDPEVISAITFTLVASVPSFYADFDCVANAEHRFGPDYAIRNEVGMCEIFGGPPRARVRRTRFIGWDGSDGSVRAKWMLV